MIASISWLLPWHSLYGDTYQFWSGIGSDIGELTLIGAVFMAYRHMQCHQSGCHRLGRFQHEHFRLCRVHHPKVPSKGKITAGGTK